MQSLNSVVQSIGGMNQDEVEQQCLIILTGIRAAKKKIADAVDQLRAAKYIIKRRTQFPENVVKMAIRAKNNAIDAEFKAIYERDRMKEQYRNFRGFLYIMRSMSLLVPLEPTTDSAVGE